MPDPASPLLDGAAQSDGTGGAVPQSPDMRRRLSLPQKFLRVGLAAIPALMLFVQARLFWEATIDDAFITFRYAEHWAHGQGLVFNPGERVEGFSNFLWVAIMAAVSYLGLDMVAVAKALGLVSLLGTMALSLRLLRRAGMRGFWPGLALAFLFDSYVPFVFMAVTGLETVFFAFLLLLLLDRLWAEEGRPWASSAALLAMIGLARPEGVAYFVAISPVVWWRSRERPRDFALWWGGVAIVLGTFLALRWSYYGDLLPNTFYAKPSTVTLGGIVGLAVTAWLSLPEFARFIAAAGGPVAVALAVIAAVAPDTRRQLALPSLILLVGAAFQVYSGPDWMNTARFAAPVWPIFVVLALAGWDKLAEQAPSRWGLWGLGIWVAVTVALNVQQGADFWSRRREYPNFVLTSEDMIAASRWMAERYPPAFSVVCWRIGALGYYGRLNVIDDRWGLIDRHIARLRHENRLTDEARDSYLAERNPELYIRQTLGAAVAPASLRVGGREYLFVARFPQGSGEWWDLYQRADLPPPPL